MSKKIKSVIQTIFYLLPFLIIGIYIGSLAAESSIWTLFVYFAVSMVLFMIAILVHEAGHLIFGLLTGYEFSSFRIANLMWYKVGQTIRFTTFSIPGTGGQCIMLPPMDLEEIPYFWYNAGGGLGNLIFSTILVLVGGIYQELGSYLTLFVLINAAIGLMNLIPMNGLIPNDGYNILLLYKSKRARQAFALSLWIADAQLRGMRIKDIEASFFLDPIEEDYANPITINFALYKINRLLDQGEYHLAKQEIEYLLEKAELDISKLHRHLLVLELLYFDLIEGDLTRIEDLYDKSIQSTVKSMAKTIPSASRFLFAYEKFFKRDIDAANKWQNVFDKVGVNYPYQGDLEFERELMDLAREADLT